MAPYLRTSTHFNPDRLVAGMDGEARVLRGVRLVLTRIAAQAPALLQKLNGTPISAKTTALKASSSSATLIT